MRKTLGALMAIPGLGIIEPCLPVPAKVPPSRPGWIHEIKHDGFRILARRDKAGVRLITRAANDFARRFPFIAMAVGKLQGYGSPLIRQVWHAVPGRGTTGRHVGLSAGDDRMREYSEYVACPCCGGTMGLARTVSHAEVPPLETFECKPCGLAVTAEAVSGSHALIEKRYFS